MKHWFPDDHFDKIVQKAKRENWKALDLGELVATVGRQFVGTPYLANSLEISDDRETCVVRLDGFDCVTFYETSLCFARIILAGRITWDDLVGEVTFVRYRGGKLNGYLARLHYTSDWIHDNVVKGVVEDIGARLPGANRLHKKIDFMSSHAKLYRQLAAHADWVPKMASLEAAITARSPIYVPNDHLGEVEPLLRSGDIVGIVTEKAGLDCSHTGLLSRQDGSLRFVNASTLTHCVRDDQSLISYLAGSSSSLGIMIARPKKKPFSV